MADVPLHPTVMEGETTESLRATKQFFVKCGLMKEEDNFISSDKGSPLDADFIDVPDLAADTCRENCRAALEIAKLACSLTGDVRRCRRKAEAAYHICIAACGL